MACGKKPGVFVKLLADPKDHDFCSEVLGIAAPYGIYDVVLNSGIVVVGKSADTPEFAVNSIATWWLYHGSQQRQRRRASRHLVHAIGSKLFDFMKSLHCCHKNHFSFMIFMTFSSKQERRKVFICF